MDVEQGCGHSGEVLGTHGGWGYSMCAKVTQHPRLPYLLSDNVQRVVIDKVRIGVRGVHVQRPEQPCRRVCGQPAKDTILPVHPVRCEFVIICDAVHTAPIVGHSCRQEALSSTGREVLGIKHGGMGSSTWRRNAGAA
jgi:hypothetical protein